MGNGTLGIKKKIEVEQNCSLFLFENDKKDEIFLRKMTGKIEKKRKSSKNS